MAESECFVALALQTTSLAVNRALDPRRLILDSCARIADQIADSKRFIGPDLRLVVLPEYVLTGFPMGETTGAWIEKAALASDGPEYRSLSDTARQNGIYLSGNAYERDSHFPELYFQTSFLIAPLGEVVLRYRRLISLYSPSPVDVLDRYLAIYGLDALFPVAETEIGRIAAIASEEILYPEIARAHALRGAEIFVHSSSEVASPHATPKNIAKQSRAIENLAFVVSANTAGIEGIGIPKSSTDGGSKIIDHRGLVLAEAAVGESMAAHAEIDLGASRRARRRPGMANTLSRLPMDVFSHAIAGVDIQPSNLLIDGTGAIGAPTRDFYARRQRAAIARLMEREIIN